MTLELCLCKWYSYFDPSKLVSCISGIYYDETVDFEFGTAVSYTNLGYGDPVHFVTLQNELYIKPTLWSKIINKLR